MGTTVAVLIAVGAILLFLETFLPGMIAGLAGLACLVAAIILGYQSFDIQTAHLVLVGVVVGLAAGVFAWLKFFPNSRFARPFISQGTIGSANPENQTLLGETGTTVTPLRPAGTVLINGHRFDVVSDGSFIEQGANIKVVEVQGLRIVVRAQWESNRQQVAAR